MQRAQVSSSLTASFTLARSEAARRAVSVTVCPIANGTSCASESSPDWKTGWLVFTDLDGDGVIDADDELLDTVRFENPAFTLAPASALGKPSHLRQQRLPWKHGFLHRIAMIR